MIDKETFTKEILAEIDNYRESIYENISESFKQFDEDIEFRKEWGGYIASEPDVIVVSVSTYEIECDIDLYLIEVQEDSLINEGGCLPVRSPKRFTGRFDEDPDYNEKKEILKKILVKWMVELGNYVEKVKPYPFAVVCLRGTGYSDFWIDSQTLKVVVPFPVIELKKFLDRRKFDMKYYNPSWNRHKMDLGFNTL